jgi:Na+-transporting NADH:ubiquinone oxidoreductase subunit NqrD
MRKSTRWGKLVRQLVNLIVSCSLTLKFDQVLYRYYYRTMKSHRNVVSLIIAGIEKCRGSKMRAR